MFHCVISIVKMLNNKPPETVKNKNYINSPEIHSSHSHSVILKERVRKKYKEDKRNFKTVEKKSSKKNLKNETS